MNKESKPTPEITVVNSADKDAFEKNVNGLLKRGWKMSSSGCGFVNSAEYNFCDCFHAIMIKGE